MKLLHQCVLLTTLLLAVNFHNIVGADSQLANADTEKHKAKGDLFINEKIEDDNKQAIHTVLLAQKLQDQKEQAQDSSPIMNSDFDETKEFVMVVPVSSDDSTINNNGQHEIGKMTTLKGNDGVIALEELAVAESGYRRGPLPYYRQNAYYRPQYYGYARPNYYNNNNNNYYYSRPRPQYNTYGYNPYGWNSYNSAPIIGFSFQG